MNRTLASTTLAAALGLAYAVAVQPARAADTPPQMTDKMLKTGKFETCFGVAAKGRNDCAAGAHSCAGQSTADRDPASFVLLPAGDCSKIAGGSLKHA